MARDIARPSRRHGLSELLATVSFAEPDSSVSKEQALAYLNDTGRQYVSLEDYWQAVVRSQD